MKAAAKAPASLFRPEPATPKLGCHYLWWIERKTEESTDCVDYRLLRTLILVSQRTSIFFCLNECTDFLCVLSFTITKQELHFLNLK